MKIVYTVTFADGNSLDFIGAEGTDFRHIYTIARETINHSNSEQRTPKGRVLLSDEVKSIEIRDLANAQRDVFDDQQDEIDRLQLLWEILE